MQHQDNRYRNVLSPSTVSILRVEAMVQTGCWMTEQVEASWPSVLISPCVDLFVTSLLLLLL
jgi:hypothetical protein